MKTFIRRTALTTLAIALLLGGTTAAFASTPSQTLSATMAGGVTNLGAQTYTISGGQILYGSIAQYTISPSSASLQYNVVATQNGLSTNGVASISFKETVDGTRLRVSGSFPIGGADMGAGLPAGCETPPTYTPCSEILPFDFIGSSTVQLTIGHQTVPETMVIESPYWNPYGGPIYLISETNGVPDGAIAIVAYYNQATIQWTGAQTGGILSGTFAGSPVSGTFTQTSNEFENLVTGTATDSGTIQLSTGVTALDSQGTFTGSDYIPSQGAMDCSGPTSSGGDGIPYTCYLTGFISQGNFRAGEMSGTYSTTWGVPAYTFTSNISATVTQPGTSDNLGGFGNYHGFGGFLNFHFPKFLSWLPHF